MASTTNLVIGACCDVAAMLHRSRVRLSTGFKYGAGLSFITRGLVSERVLREDRDRGKFLNVN